MNGRTPAKPSIPAPVRRFRGRTSRPDAPRTIRDIQTLRVLRLPLDKDAAGVLDHDEFVSPTLHDAHHVPKR